MSALQYERVCQWGAVIVSRGVPALIHLTHSQRARSLAPSKLVLVLIEFVQALRVRARKQRAARKPHLGDIKPGSVIENMAQTRRLAETALVGAGVSTTLPPPSTASLTLEDDKPTNTGSGSQVCIPIISLLKFISSTYIIYV